MLNFRKSNWGINNTFSLADLTHKSTLHFLTSGSRISIKNLKVKTKSSDQCVPFSKATKKKCRKARSPPAINY